MTATAGPAQAARRRPWGQAAERAARTTRTGLALVSPALLLVGVFALFPLGFGIYISLTDWPLIGAYHFIGLANYTRPIHNTVFLQSIVFTLKYTAIVTVPIFVLGYALAVFVRSNRPGSTLFRTMIFLPYIVGLVAESYMAVVELQPDSGTANFVLAKFGIVSASTAWLVHTGLALTAISILVVWFASGLTMMLLMAGMQGIPHEVYESARVDGASWWSIERRLTLPLLRRSIALSLIISVVGSFLAFNQFFIMTDGGPGTSTVPVVMSIFDTAFAAHERRPGQRDVGGPGGGRGDHHLHPVPLPAGRRRLMAVVRNRQARSTGHDAAAGRPGRRARGRAAGSRRPAGRGRGFGWYVLGGILISAVFVVPLLWEVFRSLQPESAVSAARPRQTLQPPDLRQLPGAALGPGRHHPQRDEQPDRRRGRRAADRRGLHAGGLRLRDVPLPRQRAWPSGSCCWPS